MYILSGKISLKVRSGYYTLDVYIICFKEKQSTQRLIQKVNEIWPCVCVGMISMHVLRNSLKTIYGLKTINIIKIVTIYKTYLI